MNVGVKNFSQKSETICISRYIKNREAVHHEIFQSVKLTLCRPVYTNVAG